MSSYIDKFIGGYDAVGAQKPETVEIFQGGKNYFKTAGDEHEFQLRDMMLNIKYLDTINDLDFTNIKTLHKIAEIFKLETKNVLDELNYLLSLSDDELVQLYSKRFKLYLIFKLHFY